MTTKSEANPKVIIKIENSPSRPAACADVTLIIDGSETRKIDNLNVYSMLATVTEMLRHFPDAEIIDTATEEEPEETQPAKTRQVKKDPANPGSDPYNDAIIEKMVHNNCTLA